MAYEGRERPAPNYKKNPGLNPLGSTYTTRVVTHDDRKDAEGVRGWHREITPAEALEIARANIISGGPAADMQRANLSVNSPQVQDILNKQNTHAHLFATDPAYRAKWQSEHGSMWESGGSFDPVKSAFNVFALAGLGGGLGGSTTAPASGTSGVSGISSAVPAGTDPITGSTLGGGLSIADPAYAGGLSSSSLVNSAGAAGGINALSNAGGGIGNVVSDPGKINAGTTQTGGSMSTDAMNWLNAGGSLLSGILGYNAANDAADQQHDAYMAGLGEMGRQFDVSQGNIQPFMDAGSSQLPFLQQGASVEGLDQILGQIMDTDTFGELVNERRLGVEGMLGAGGLTRSGEAIEEGARIPTDLAMSISDILHGRASSLATGGQNAAVGAGHQAMNYGANAAQLMGNAGNASASGTLGGQMAIDNTIEGILAALMNTTRT